MVLILLITSPASNAESGSHKLGGGGVAGHVMQASRRCLVGRKGSVAVKHSVQLCSLKGHLQPGSALIGRLSVYEPAFRYSCCMQIYHII